MKYRSFILSLEYCGEIIPTESRLSCSNNFTTKRSPNHIKVYIITHFIVDLKKVLQTKIQRLNFNSYEFCGPEIMPIQL